MGGFRNVASASICMKNLGLGNECNIRKIPFPRRFGISRPTTLRVVVDIPWV